MRKALFFLPSPPSFFSSIQCGCGKSLPPFFRVGAGNDGLLRFEVTIREIGILFFSFLFFPPFGNGLGLPFAGNWPDVMCFLLPPRARHFGSSEVGARSFPSPPPSPPLLWSRHGDATAKGSGPRLNACPPFSPLSSPLGVEEGMLELMGCSSSFFSLLFFFFLFLHCGEDGLDGTPAKIDDARQIRGAKRVPPPPLPFVLVALDDVLSSRSVRNRGQPLPRASFSFFFSPSAGRIAQHCRNGESGRSRNADAFPFFFFFPPSFFFSSLFAPSVPHDKSST